MGSSLVGTPHPNSWYLGHTKDVLSSDVMVSMWNYFFVSFPCKRTSSGLPNVAEFSVILLLLSLFQSNLPQILLSFNYINLCPGLQIAVYLITLFLLNFLTSYYIIFLFVHFITANWSLRASLTTGLSYWPLTCHFLGLKSLPFTLCQALCLPGFNWNVTFLERLSVHTQGSLSFSQTLLFYIITYLKIWNMVFLLCLLVLSGFIKL